MCWPLEKLSVLDWFISSYRAQQVEKVVFGHWALVTLRLLTLGA